MSIRSIIKSLVDYNPDNGEFRWKCSRGNKQSGSLAGYLRHGYITIKINGKQYAAHRIAWLLTHGMWPNGDIDHINGNILDNRIINLRDVDRTTNLRNMTISSLNTSGITGVHWCKTWGKWKAQISGDGKRVVLGSFDNLLDAVCARKSAEIEYGYHPNHGRQPQPPTGER